MNTATERAISFDCCGDRLVGILHDAPDSDGTRPGILVIVGGPQYRAGSHRQFVAMARRLAAAGYPVLRFDYRGMGDSEGELRPFDDIDADISAAIDAWMRHDPQLPGVVLWGLCDGASAAMIYCARDDRVVGLVAVNPWVRTDEAEARSYVKHYYFERLLQRSFWVKLLTFRVNLRASAGDFMRKLRRSLAPSTPAEGRGSDGGFIGRMSSGLSAFRGPSLLVISERDLTAGQFQELVGRDPDWSALMRKRIVTTRTINGADHTFSSESAARSAIEAVLQWLESVSVHIDRVPLHGRR